MVEKKIESEKVIKQIPEASFPKSERLLKIQEFVYVQRQGKRFYSRNFIILVAKITKASKQSKSRKNRGFKNNSAKVSNNQADNARLGVTITNKTEPSSVKRNRVKRMIREAFRKFKGSCVSGIAIVVIAKSGAVELNTREVHEQLSAALKFNGFFQ